MDSIYADMKYSEKQVAEYLKELGLWWIHQSPVFVYDDKDRPECGHLIFTFQNWDYI